MNIKLWSLLLTSLIPAVATQEDDDYYLDSEWMDTDFNDNNMFQQWSDNTNEFVKSIKEKHTKITRDGKKFGIVDVFAPVFSDVKAEVTCGACDVFMRTVHTLTHIPFTHNLLIKGFKAGCRLAGRPGSECDGYIDRYGEPYLSVLYDMDFEKDYMGELACFHLLRACPHPQLPDTQLDLPAPNQISIPQPSGKELKILHLSDFHYDREYAEGSEADCRRSLCCQRDSTIDEQGSDYIKKPASRWGEYQCDMPLSTLESMLQHIGDMHSKEPFDMVIFTGDVPAHDAFKESPSRSKATEHAAYDLLSKYINPQSTKFYPVIGNHESVPSNLYPILGSGKERDYDLYDFLANEWDQWLPESALSSVKSSGFYSVQHSDNLKIIVLNNNLCYSYNVWLFLDPENEDPNGMFAWVIRELEDAKRTGSRVYVASHVPPASADCHQKFSRTWNKIVKAYSDVIISQFYGHTHHDEFELYYGDGPKTANNAIANSFIAPSITTHVKMNPGFRVYNVDAKHYQVKDFTQYYTNLNEQNSWSQGPEWKKLYQAKQLYNVPASRGPYIDAKFWHQVTELMERNNTAFEKFTAYRYKNSGLHPECDESCKAGLICNLRASNSQEICDTKFQFNI